MIGFIIQKNEVLPLPPYTERSTYLLSPLVFTDPFKLLLIEHWDLRFDLLQFTRFTALGLEESAMHPGLGLLALDLNYHRGLIFSLERLQDP